MTVTQALAVLAETPARYVSETVEAFPAGTVQALFTAGYVTRRDPGQAESPIVLTMAGVIALNAVE